MYYVNVYGKVRVLSSEIVWTEEDLEALTICPSDASVQYRRVQIVVSNPLAPTKIICSIAPQFQIKICVRIPVQQVCLESDDHLVGARGLGTTIWARRS